MSGLLSLEVDSVHPEVVANVMHQRFRNKVSELESFVSCLDFRNYENRIGPHSYPTPVAMLNLPIATILCIFSS